MAIPEPHFLWKILRTIVQGVLRDHPNLKDDLDTITSGKRMGISVTLEGVKEMHKLLTKWMERWSKEELTAGPASRGKTRAKGKGGLKGKEESSLTPDKKGKGPGRPEGEDEVTQKGTETTVCKFFQDVEEVRIAHSLTGDCLGAQEGAMSAEASFTDNGHAQSSEGKSALMRNGAATNLRREEMNPSCHHKRTMWTMQLTLS